MLGAIGGLVSAGLGFLGSRQQSKDLNKQMDLQKDTAQNQVLWRTRDAERAGIHPIFALGMPPVNISPAGVGGLPDLSGLERAGQDIDQSIMRNKSPEVRNVVTRAVTKLALEKGALENDLLRTQLVRATRELSPPIPTPGKKLLIAGGKGDRLSGPGASSITQDVGVRYEPVPLPDGSVGYVGVRVPGGGQRMEDHYSDVAGSGYGVGAASIDADRNLSNALEGMGGSTWDFRSPYTFGRSVRRYYGY